MEQTGQIPMWRETPKAYAILAATVLLLGIVFWGGLVEMERIWSRAEEYSHGYILVLVFFFLLWQKKSALAAIEFSGSWLGFSLVLLGAFCYLLGELSTLFIIVQYSLLLCIFGLFLAYMGWQGFRKVLPILFLLVFLIPLPVFINNQITGTLQLISSELGVAVIRLFGISVYLEGNVIDLGNYKLQVVEACAGLNYLFPLMSLGYITAYLFKGAFWKKAVIFLSTIPITVFMNSFRIGVIGVLVEYWGQSMADGFLHDFEGWLVFMACAAMLVLEMWVLTMIGRGRMPLREAFTIDMPAPATAVKPVNQREVPASFYAAFSLLLALAVASQMLPNRSEIIPDRATFDQFPSQLGEWNGKVNRLEDIYIEALKLDDYLLEDYQNDDGQIINLYMAYYASQRKGASAHSPKSCLPGGGWEMQRFEQKTIDGVKVVGRPLVVNRVLIQLGDIKQVVYYWFQQRGRVINNEYLVKWYLFWDSLTRSRTDGALVRLTSMVKPGQDMAEVDSQLEGFARDASAEFGRFLPE